MHLHKENYILLCDPILKPGEQKVYRYNGVVGPNEPEIHLKDPRIPKTSHIKFPLELHVPRFKIDENYVGTPPAIEVSIMNLNDNIRKEFLRDNILIKFGAIEKIQILHHPLTNQHLGLAKVTYFKPSAASSCVEKLNGHSVMGNVLSVFHDPFAKRITEYYHEIVNPTQNYNVPTISDHGDEHDGKKDGKSKLSNGYKSPERECLEWRISHMIRDPKITSQSPLFKSIKRMRDNMQDEKDDLLKMPPSPFLSSALYVKWNRITREIERGSDQMLIERLVQNDSDKEDQHYADMDMSCSSEESSGPAETTNNSSQNHRESSFQRSDSQQQQNLPQYKFSTFGQHQHQNGGQPAPIFNTKLLNFNFSSSFSKEASSSSKDTAREKKPELFTLSDRKRLSEKIIRDSYELFRKELADIIIKDIYKKTTDNYAFRLFDNWWDEQEKAQADSKNTPIKAMEESMDNSRMVPSFNARIDNINRDDHASEHPLPQLGMNLSLGFGDLRASLRCLTFKKKISKPTPRRVDTSDSEGESSHVEDRNKKFKTPAQRRKMLSPTSQSSKSAASQSDNEDETADSDDDDDSSKASSLSSSSESSDSDASSSSSEPSSDDEDSDNESTADEEKESLVSSSKSPQSISVSESQNSTSQVLSPSRSESISSPKSESIPEPSVGPSVEEDEEDEDDDDEDEEEDEEDVEDSQDSQEARVDVQAKAKEDEEEEEDVSDLASISQDAPQPDVDMHSDIDMLSDVPEDDLPAESYHGSSTDTADETIDELRKLAASEAAKKQKRTKKRSTPNETEFEASQALMALAGICDDKRQELASVSLRDPISEEHNYARLPLVPKKRGRKPKPESEKKPRGKGKKVQDENQAPDLSALYQLGAVATEMRKAKQIAGIKEVEKVEEKKELLYQPRTEAQEEVVFWDMHLHGMDHEDRSYLKRSFEQMKAEGREEDLVWLKDISWVDHPTTAASPPKKSKKSKEERTHKTGSARTEGYYKIGFLEKQKYSHVANTSTSGHAYPDETVTRVRQMATTNQLSREARQNQRRLLATYDSVYTDLLKFSQLKFRKKQLKFSKSVIHDWGLFALEPIAADEMIIEYVGERVRSLVADIREKRYEECGIGSSYLFRVDGECIVDATKCGNVARFINHSCVPNCYAKVVTVEGSKKIVIYSKQQIAVGEEITYDYKFPIEEDNKISCLCGAQGCRGFLN